MTSIDAVLFEGPSNGSVVPSIPFVDTSEPERASNKPYHVFPVHALFLDPHEAAYTVPEMIGYTTHAIFSAAMRSLITQLRTRDSGHIPLNERFVYATGMVKQEISAMCPQGVANTTHINDYWEKSAKELLQDEARKMRQRSLLTPDNNAYADARIFVDKKIAGVFVDYLTQENVNYKLWQSKRPIVNYLRELAFMKPI